MPLYEYECDDCAHRFERIQKFSDPPVEQCPSCGGRVRKLLSSPAIQFKGTGWYITDYAKKPSGDSGKGVAQKGDGKPGEGKSSDTADSGSATSSSESGSATTSTASKTESKTDNK